jgi:NADH:ubiquinone oxidoreductase subunit E
MDIDGLDIDKEMARLGKVVCEEDRKKSLLVPMLHRIQENYGYLTEDALERLSRKLGISLAQVYGVASFYHQFYFSPRGRTIARVCVGTACHVRGASRVLQGLKDHFGIGVGETTNDLEMTLETVGCVGCCGLAPVATVNGDLIGEIGSKKLESLISMIEVGE